MQTTLNSVWSDIYADYGLLGVAGLIVFFIIITDKYPHLKFWANNRNGLNKLLNNHIEHMRKDITEIKVALAEKASVELLGKEIKDLKKDMNDRMNRIEGRIK